MDPLDELNAKKYATNCYLEYKYKRFLKILPHIFKHVNIDIRTATHDDYYVPPSLASQCKVVRLTFSEIGCQKIACFPYTKNLEKCNPMDEARYLNLGSFFTLACQPGCTQLNINRKYPIDTEFRNNKCMMVNAKKKMFALFPESVHDVKTIQPLNVGFNLVNGHLEINEDYCKYYGLDFKNGQCEYYTHQKAGELFLGTSVYRSMIRFNTLPHKPPPSAPHYLKDVDSWLEGYKVRRKRSLSNYSQVNESLASSLAKEIAADVAIEMSAHQIKNLLKRKIPSILTKGHLAMTPITKSVLSQLVVGSAVNTTIQVSKAAAMGLSYFMGIYAVASIVTVIVDIFDPFHFNHIIDRNTLKQLNKRLDYEYFESNKTDVEILPEILFDEEEEDESDGVLFMISKMEEYMSALQTVDVKDRIDIQKNALNKPSSNFNINAIVTGVVFLCLSIFLEYVAVVSFIYFCILLIIQTKILNL